MRFLGEINQKIFVCLQSLWKRNLFRQKSIDLLSSCLFRSKNTQEKNFHFGYQPWTNPVKKFPYFYLFYLFCKFFSIKNVNEKSFPAYFAQNTQDENVHYLTKAMD